MMEQRNEEVETMVNRVINLMPVELKEALWVSRVPNPSCLNICFRMINYVTYSAYCNYNQVSKWQMSGRSR
jgi:hypothetical protein